MKAKETIEETRRRLCAILAKNPGCRWAKNELKYLDVDSPKLVTGGIMVSAGAYAADREYHGGYTE